MTFNSIKVYEETNDAGDVIKTTFGITRVPDFMALEEMSQYEHGLNVDRLIALSALISFVKLQNANRGYMKKIETEDNKHLENSDKIYKFNRSAPFKNLGTGKSAFGKNKNRNPFRRMK